jgi:transcriptional regulator with XRE-family HTH domain
MKLRQLVSFNLKRIRIERGMNQFDLAELCNMSLSAIQSYESMKREPKESARELIANALGIDESELYFAGKKNESNIAKINQASTNDLINVMSKHPEFFEIISKIDPESDMWRVFKRDVRAELEYQEEKEIKALKEELQSKKA